MTKITKVAVITSSVTEIMFVVVKTTFITSPMVNIIFLVAEIHFNVAVVTASVVKTFL